MDLVSCRSTCCACRSKKAPRARCTLTVTSLLHQTCTRAGKSHDWQSRILRFIKASGDRQVPLAMPEVSRRLTRTVLLKTIAHSHQLADHPSSRDGMVSDDTQPALQDSKPGCGQAFKLTTRLAEVGVLTYDAGPITQDAAAFGASDATSL